MSVETETPNSETPTTPSVTDGTPSPTPAPTTEADPPEGTTPTPTPAPAAAPEPLTAEALQFPENAQVDEGLRDEFLGVLNDAEMTPTDRANALIGMSGKLLDAASEANSAAWDNMQQQWQNEVKADPEIGGSNLQSTLDAVGNLVAEYGSDELKQALDVTGAGNNPHVIRFLHKIAGQLTETSGPTPGNPAANVSVASRLYPSMKG